jgi:aspartyl-tRNA(Asn)/glutamyl-tRNA(Gln) amidotransferase subunit A
LNKHDERDPTSTVKSTRERLLETKSLQDRSQPLRIGIPKELFAKNLSQKVKNAFHKLFEALSPHVELQLVNLPTSRFALSAYYILAPAEASSNLSKYDGVRYGLRTDDSPDYSNTRGASFGEEVKRRILMGTFALTSE